MIKHWTLIILIFSFITLSNTWCYESEFILSSEQKVRSIDYSPDGTMLVTASDTNQVEIFATTNYILKGNYKRSGRKAYVARFSKSGTMIAIGYDDDDVHVIHTTNFTFLGSFASGHGFVLDLEFNEASTKLVTCGDDQRIRVKSVPAFGSLQSINEGGGGGNQILSCKFGLNDDRVGYGGKSSKNVVVMTPGSNTTKLSQKVEADEVWCIDFRASNSLIQGNKDSKGYLVTVNSSSSVLTTGSSIASCANSRAGDYYAFGNSGMVYIYNNSNSLVQTLKIQAQATAIRFNYQGTKLAIGLTSGKVYIFKTACQQCQQNYYFNSTTSTCIACHNTITGCSSCENSTFCIACLQGFYINSTTSKCQYCNYSIGCGYCSNQTSCTYCLQGYFLNSSTCQTCDSVIPGCLQCNATTGTIAVSCSVCENNYYLNSSSKCQLCSTIPNCLTCRNSTTLTCLQCKMGYYESGSSCLTCSTYCLVCKNATFCDNCMIGYYSNTTGSCLSCSFGCEMCNSTGSCIRCFSGLYESSGSCSSCVLPCVTCNTSSYCQSCSLGYYSLGNGTCSACLNSCVTCLNSSSCTSCNVTSYLHTNASCVSCSTLVTYCSRCTNASCTLCNLGFYLNGAVCSSCNVMFGCSTCDTSTNCLTCIPGTYKTASSGNLSCSFCSTGCYLCYNSSNCYSCAPGYFLNGTTCSECPSKCYLCSSASVCSSCTVGYFLSGTSCNQCYLNMTGCRNCLNSTFCTSCLEGYYLHTNQTCVTCSKPCITCTSNTSCLSCDTGYYLNGTSCLNCNANCSSCSGSSNCSSCITGYYLSSVSCLSCPNTNCSSCNSTSCLSCKTGYFLNSSSCSLCYSNITNCLQCSSGSTCLHCSYGYSLTTGGASCSKCSLIFGCLHCSNTTACEVCQNGWYLQTNLTCSYCPSGCATCNSTACFTCLSSFTLSNTTCQLCQIPIVGCLICLNSTACLRCQAEYYLTGVSCTLCQTAMKGCFLCNTSSICTSCQQGYYLKNTTNTCQLCSVMSGCQICSSGTVCLDCESGFYLATNSCVLCSSALPGCLSCSNISTCQDCQSGFYLSTSFSCLTCSSQMNGCIFCNSSSVCLNCQSGYYLHSNNTCVVCSGVGCEVCSSSNSSNCITCNSRFYKSGTLCLACSTLQGCVQCNSSSVCSWCDAGYYLNGSSCSLCSNSLQGCSQCSSSVLCLQCKSNYFLNGTVCKSCSQTLQGCVVCANATNCLACASSYFQNGSICSPCKNINGCVFCQNSTSCLLCSQGYYLLNQTCNLCSVMVGCYSCSSSTVCTLCSGGYKLTSGNCSVLQISGNATIVTNPYTSFKLKSFYIDPTTLKHILYAASNYNQISLNWSSEAKLKIVSITKVQYSLTIKKVQYGSNGYTLIFFTDNPLALNAKPMSFTRLLLEDELNIEAKVNLDLSQNAISQILPSEPNAGNLIMDYDLSQPQFYASFASTLSWGPYLYFGIAVSIILVLIHTIRALSMKERKDFGQIIPHILSLKCAAFALYPLKKQMLSYCWGFMVLDFPWANWYFSQILCNSSDQTPKPFKIFYNNLNLASTFLLALAIILFIWCIIFLIFRSFQDKSRLKALNQLLWNIFGFGIVVASSLSLQGAFLNPIDTLNVNVSFYILGVALYILVAFYCFYLVYSDAINFTKIRILIKATLLSLLHINPIYVISGVVILQLASIIYEYIVFNKNKQHPIIASISQVLCNAAIVTLIFCPTLLSSILICSLFVGIVVGFQLFIHISEFCSKVSEQKKKAKMQLFNETQQDKNIWDIKLDQGNDMMGTKGTFDESAVYQPVRKRNKRLKNAQQTTNQIFVNEQSGVSQQGLVEKPIKEGTFFVSDFM